MSAYIMPARELETVRQLSNDERRASWASKYYHAGHHRPFWIDFPKRRPAQEPGQSGAPRTA